MMSLWVVIVCMLLVCVCVVLWSRERRARMQFKGLPNYQLLPFSWNIIQVLRMLDNKTFLRHINSLAEICEEARTPIKASLGPIYLIVAQDPDDVKAITNAFVEKPFFYDFSKVWLGVGLVTAPGYIWQRNVKKLGGSFTNSVVNGYLGVFNAQAHKLVENLKTQVGKEPFDIMHKYLAYTSLESICQTALRVSDISESIVTTKYLDAFNRCLELMIKRGLNVLVHPDVIYRLTSAHTEMIKCVTILHNFSDMVVRKRKLAREDRRKSENTAGAEDEPKFKAFLDILLELSETDSTLTEKQIQSEVNTIIFGGQETAATTMLFTLLMLGCKPRIQEKMYAELKSIFGDSKRPVRKEDLSKMEYCEAIINETLRLFPPFPGIMRYADKDLQLKSCTIPKGTVCAINSWGAGRSERVWGPDAKLYRPERWLEDQPSGNPAAFLAFGYGRRTCIGKKYAMAILKTLLAHCVRELEFVSEADNLQLKVDIALKPTSGHLLQVRLRDPK